MWLYACVVLQMAVATMAAAWADMFPADAVTVTATPSYAHVGSVAVVAHVPADVESTASASWSAVGDWHDCPVLKLTPASGTNTHSLLTPMLSNKPAL